MIAASGRSRLGNVAGDAQRADQRNPGRFAKRRRGDGLACEALRERRLGRLRGSGRKLQRLDPQVVEGRALLGQPRRLEPGQQAGLDERTRRLGPRQRVRGLGGVSCLRGRARRRLDVDPDRLGQLEENAVAAPRSSRA